MKQKSIQFLLMIASLCAVSLAHAASNNISCTQPVSTGFATAYASAGAVPNVTQGTVSFNCTRGATGDPTNLLLRADRGLYPATGSRNRAAFGSGFISYEAYRDSACTALWTDNSTANSIPFTLAAVLTPQTVNLSYWGCITLAGQAPAAGAGTYTDSVTMTIRDSGTGQTFNTGTFAVSITYPATCNITAAPGNVAFTYTAFGPAVNASTTFGATCTSNLPYTMALDAYVGVVSGLRYTLNIDTQPPPAGSTPVNSRGAGVAQTHWIYGNMQANQAGTCATGTCTATNVHTLTITY
ncbi:MAG: spore coat U domain-containing protein [Sulfuritalea sp.]|jgi:spore coat protein U-like protein|nr:spore coat U domain-containing protein [Sulfuritalea sp.]